jgi:hypothetical protein
MLWNILSRVTTWFIVNLVALVALVAVHFATSVTSLKWWADTFAVATNLLAGGLVSFLFYFLVVQLPQQRKKVVIKTNLQKLYRGIKGDILVAVVLASIQGGRNDLSADTETLDKLMTPEGFKEAFSNGREADEGFYAFENQMSDETWEFRQIVLNLQMLSKQIDYLLHNYVIEDQGAFDFFKRLELLLMRIQSNGPGYEESKRLCTFIWEIYAGWDWLEGDTGYDQVQRMIEAL